MLKNEEKFSDIYIDAWEHDGRIADMQYEIANQIVCKEKGKKDRKKIRNTAKNILKRVALFGNIKLFPQKKKEFVAMCGSRC